MACTFSRNCVAKHGENTVLINAGAEQHLEVKWQQGQLIMGLFGPNGGFKAFMRFDKEDATQLKGVIEEKMP